MHKIGENKILSNIISSDARRTGLLVRVLKLEASQVLQNLAFLLDETATSQVGAHNEPEERQPPVAMT
jgi:hypothetical protein